MSRSIRDATGLARVLIFQALLALICSGCSMRRLALDHHEWLAGRLATRYLDLDNKQEEMFQQRLKDFSFHISERVVEGKPASLAGDIAGKILLLGTVTDPLPVVDEIQAMVRQVMITACTDFAPLLANLKPDQLAHLQARMNERNAEFDPEQQGGVPAYRKDKLADLIANSERWLGLLSTDQRNALSAIDSEKDPAGQWERDYLAYSREAQAAFLGMLTAHRGDVAGLASKCRAYAAAPDDFIGGESRRTKSAVTGLRRRNVALLYATMSATQRTRLQRETAALAADLHGWVERIKATKS